MNSDGTRLYDLDDSQFEAGGIIGEAVKRAGYVDGGRAVVNQNNWWNLTLVDALSWLDEESKAEVAR